jgi:signal transduction histidine kinase
MNAEGAEFNTEHNLRTSVTIIRAASEILSDHPEMPPGERRRFQDTLVAESARLSRMIDQIMAHGSLQGRGSDQAS